MSIRTLFVKYRAAVLGAVILLVISLGFLATPRPRPVPDLPQGSFSFAVLGDAPYFMWELGRYRRVLRQIDNANLDWVLHVGDIFGQPCTDEMYQDRLSYLEHLRHPVIYTPGDNEWFDCHNQSSGGYASADRLALIRRLFFSEPGRSLGQAKLSLVTQGGVAPYQDFVENVRWEAHGIVFATVHLIGSRNGMEPFQGRTDADDRASKLRTEAAAAWLREAFSAARKVNAWAVFIAFHADLHLELAAGSAERRSFEPFITTLEEESGSFAGRVVIAHGDGHEFTVDHPLFNRANGIRLENVTRLEVPGSPHVGWVRVLVTPGSGDPFRFENYVFPSWMLW